jgi:hypothetical protein
MAISGVNKVVYCARAKTLITGELTNVNTAGVSNVCKAGWCILKPAEFRVETELVSYMGQAPSAT